MSNTIFNLRVLYWHFQILRDRPYVRFGFNAFRWERGERSPWIQLH